MTTTCASCGQSNLPEFRVCIACGRALTATPTTISAADPGTPFVGRHRELHLLQSKLNDALNGDGQLVMLAGEAGIGKTSIAQAFTSTARLHGALVLWGRCFEGEWQPPYAPWVEALGAYVLGSAPEHLRHTLGAGAPILAQLLPELRAALPAAPPIAALHPDEERFRLANAVTQALLNAAHEQPIVLVLDDLHWADRDSLGLLRRVARFTQRARLLIVGAYRDPDPDQDRQNLLADLLGILRRETPYERILLRGLDYADIAAYLAHAADHAPLETLVQAIYTETDGNPFYVREIVQHMLEEGRLPQRVSPSTKDWTTTELGIPVSIKEVLRRRITRLAATTATMLRCAAAFTDGFEFRVLQFLTDLPEDVLLDALDEALNAGFIRTLDRTPAAYDFTHALMRHTLYDELNPDRRARIHRRVAAALERVHAGHELEVAAELAAQYHASAILPGSAQGVPYALVAAEQARAHYAYEQVVVLLRMAHDLAASSQPSVRAEILCKLAVAEAERLLLDDAQRTVEAAIVELTAADTAPATIANFLTLVARALKDGGAPPAIWERFVEQGLALIGHSPQTDARTWARLTLLRDRFEPVADGVITASRWLGYDQQAVAIARANGAEDDYAQTLELFDWRSAEETAHILSLARRWQQPAAVLRALNVAARDALFSHGAFREALERGQELLATASRYGSLVGQAEALAHIASVRICLGDLLLAQQTAARAHELVARLGTTHRLHVILTVAIPGVFAYYLDGDWPTITQRVSEFAANPGGGRQRLLSLQMAAIAALGYTRMGDPAAARQLLSVLTPVLEQMPATMHHHNTTVHAAAAAIWELGAQEFAARYRQMALDLQAAKHGDSPFGANILMVARMAALCGDMAEAHTYFIEARVQLDATGQRPSRALLDYDLALAHIRMGTADTAQITLLLDSALASFHALGMESWARRALEQRALAIPHAAPTPPTTPRYPDGLTPREVEVLRLIARGKTTREIAEALVVSPATVERHITNIYGKIGARGRADATAYALAHRLSQHI